eukprot:MONOS_16092.1-p1 / transcript=MONOS_16092.1 / gene=MONOS_16092 / organism=Monocercomonoides_exilis_PA203 / gene_product=unspecified product / transcript_product=unspecified product / location=Mono_scaffold01500:6236-7742(+) / protein_length=451 / sequence_SO=supercontig / SO=protein_coding / is_pseudo=false
MSLLIPAYAISASSYLKSNSSQNIQNDLQSFVQPVQSQESSEQISTPSKNSAICNEKEKKEYHEEKTKTSSINDEFVSKKEIAKKMINLVQQLLTPSKTRTPDMKKRCELKRTSTGTLRKNLGEKTTSFGTPEFHSTIAASTHSQVNEPTKSVDVVMTPTMTRVFVDTYKTQLPEEQKTCGKKDDDESEDTAEDDSEGDLMEPYDDSEYLEDEIVEEDDNEIDELDNESINQILANISEECDDHRECVACVDKQYNKSDIPSNSCMPSGSNSTENENDLKKSKNNSQFKRPTRMDVALERVGKEGAMKYLSTAPLWSISTVKKHAWVGRLLERWCEKVERKVWPLEWNVARGFVLFCGKECKYSLTSIVHVIVPSIKRMSIEKRSRKLNKKTVAAMNDAIRFLRYDKEVKKRGKEREPALLLDVERVISFIPNVLDSKEMEAAMYLMSVQT